MLRPDDGKMAAVHRGDFVYPQPFGDRDYRGVNRAQGKVAIRSDKFSDPEPISGSNRFDAKGPAG